MANDTGLVDGTSRAGTEAIGALYERVLQPRLAALEDLRLTLRGRIVKAAACVGVPFVVFFFSDAIAWATGLSEALVGVLGIAGVIVGVVVAAVRFALPGFTAYANYQARFKHEVVDEIFRAVLPGATYSPHEGLAESAFDAAGLFLVRGSYQSDDLVRGRIGRTPFEAAEVRRRYATGGKNSRTVMVFHGLFFRLDVGQSLRGRTIVQPRTSEARVASRDGLDEIAIGEAAFDAAYQVFTSDATEARRILTPAMLAGVLAIGERTGRRVHLALAERHACLGVHYGRALFEPGISAATARESLEEMAAQFALAEGIVRELDLDAGRTTADDTWRPSGSTHRDPRMLEAMAKASRGGLTEADLIQAVVSAAGQQDVDPAALVPDPPDRRTRVDHEGGQTRFQYPMGVAFWTAVAVSLACAAAVSAAARRVLPDSFAWVPPIPPLDTAMADAPAPLLAGVILVGGLVGFFTTIGWMLRVRRVDVGPGEVRIHRGFRPWPRTYARAEYGRVVVAGNAVFLARTQGVSLINVTASPTLGEAEARWVGAELTRALDRAGARLG